MAIAASVEAIELVVLNEFLDRTRRLIEQLRSGDNTGLVPGLKLV